MSSVLALGTCRSAPQQCPLPGSPSTHSCPWGGWPLPPRLPSAEGLASSWQQCLGAGEGSAVAFKEPGFRSREREAFRENSLGENERRRLTPRPRAGPAPISPPPFSPLLSQSFHSLNSPSKTGFALLRGLLKSPRAPAERRGERGWPPGVLPGPRTEPGTSLPAAAAGPRLRLGSQRGSAWGAAAAGSPRASSEAADRGAWGPRSARGAAPRRAPGRSRLPPFQPAPARPGFGTGALSVAGEACAPRGGGPAEAPHRLEPPPRGQRSRPPGRAPLLRARVPRRPARFPGRPGILTSLSVAAPHPQGSRPPATCPLLPIADTTFSGTSQRTAWLQGPPDTFTISPDHKWVFRALTSRDLKAHEPLLAFPGFH